MNFRDIAETVLHASPARQTEVVVIRQDESLTRFANNSIHQNVTERNVQISVRSVVEKRIGIAISNDIRTESLKQLAVRAYELAKLQPESPDFNGLPGPRPVADISAFDRRTAECTPEERASKAGIICSKAAASHLTAAGSMTTSSMSLGVANSLGVFAETEGTMADLSTVIMSRNSSGWAQATSGAVDAIDSELLADEALTKVRLGADPGDLTPGEYTVVLDPYAVADMLDMLGFDAGALAVQEGRSWMNGRFGQKIMADIVTIVDNGLDLHGIPMPFDFEGVPKQIVPLVERGIAMGPVYDSFTAGREHGLESTGHATPPSPSDRLGPLPLNQFLQPGDSTLEELIQSTGQGLYITRFWYTRPVHPRDAVITGMTRDGTFIIRGGEIAHPVKSLRFTQSYVEALKNVEAIGCQPRILKSGLGTCSVPPIKIAGFRFTSATK